MKRCRGATSLRFVTTVLLECIYLQPSVLLEYIYFTNDAVTVLLEYIDLLIIYRMAGNIGVELYLAVGEMKPVSPNFNPPI